MGAAIYNAHRYLIEELSGEHAHTMLISRFINFMQNLIKSSKKAVHIMLYKVFKDVSTITGKNIRYIEELTGNKIDLLKTSIRRLKKSTKFCIPDSHEKWRVNLIKEISNIKQKVLVLENDSSNSSLSTDELNEILNFTCTS